MRYHKPIILILLVCLLLGCTETITDDDPAKNFAGTSAYQLIALAPVLVKLAAFDTATNRHALDIISDRYDVDVTTPTVTLLAAAKDCITAYRAVAAKMVGGRDLGAVELRQALDVTPAD